jgi:hypothetical protein
MWQLLKYASDATFSHNNLVDCFEDEMHGLTQTGITSSIWIVFIL